MVGNISSLSHLWRITPTDKGALTLKTDLSMNKCHREKKTVFKIRAFSAFCGMLVEKTEIISITTVEVAIKDLATVELRRQRKLWKLQEK